MFSSKETKDNSHQMEPNNNNNIIPNNNASSSTSNSGNQNDDSYIMDSNSGSSINEPEFSSQERSYSTAHLNCDETQQQTIITNRVRAYSVSAKPGTIGNLRQGSGSDGDMASHSVCLRRDMRVGRSLSSTLASIHSVHPQIDLNLNDRFIIMPMNDQIRELQTVIRDKRTARGDFKFYADRLIRLVVEEGLNQLPIEKVEVQTPTGHIFSGIRYLKGNCGVSIVRSGESMEQGLRDCCRSIRIGKILIESDENNQARALYAKFPRDISQRRILLLYPIMSTGLAVIESVKVLLHQGVEEGNLILLNLFSSPKAAKLINQKYPKMFVLTSDINPVCPNHFGHRYFGTD